MRSWRVKELSRVQSEEETPDTKSCSHNRQGRCLLLLINKRDLTSNTFL